LAFDSAPKNIREIFPYYQNKDFILFQINSGDVPFTSHMRYDFKTKVFNYYDGQFNDEENQFLQNRFPRKILRDKTGLLWVGTRPNFYKQAPKTRQIAHYRHDPKDPESLPNDTINVLFQDSKERLWIGTRNGISLLVGENTFQQQYSSKSSSPKNSLGNIQVMYEDSNGRIWVSVGDKGLYRWDERTRLFVSIPFIPSAPYISAIIEGTKGNIWISVWTKGVYVLDAVSGNVLQRFEEDKKDIHLLTSTRIAGLFKDSRDQIWLGDHRDNDQGLFRYVDENEHFKHYSANLNDSLSLTSNELRDIIEDDLGRMWVGTDGGLNLYDHTNDYFLQNSNKINLPSVSNLAQSRGGKIWVATYSGEGLAHVGPGVDDVEFFNEQKGLLHNDIMGYRTQLPMDDFGKLWLPTERGLSVFDTTNKTFASYFKEDGLQRYEGFRTQFKTKNGDIWIGGLQGLNHIIPKKLAARDNTLPSMVITRMGIMENSFSAADGKLFEKAVSYTDYVTLKYTQRNLSFEFVALHYLRPEDNLYSWKLENYDTDWSTPSKERKASYTNLSPGEYTFRVKGSNADGIWNEEGTAIRITIAPPWWQTWWAYTLYGLVLLYAGYRVHLYQKARTLKKAQEAAQKKELEQAKEIKKAYAELKATQTQLIQSEKMASLGELTAGIAHEIQNPLNFVNNFAEVNKELLDEIEEEIGKGNLEEVKALAKDVSENEDKILFHGKRADGIVKGMLQHSRASSGEKEATDINVLADEYLRLAYHGLRAKDKSFNAAMETAFDKKIGKIQVVPQDLGRVILNLITNAFYAVKDKKQQIGEGYQPTVSVSTRKEGDTILVTIQDNGNGIPKKVLNKIFQPFFTTKPTGQGTGLGLSLSYDIVKAHDGEITVDTKEGEGTTFTLKLPAKS
jgi:signal transduction histidine kinase/ligand-binding sensor domain-containing protein